MQQHYVCLRGQLRCAGGRRRSTRARWVLTRLPVAGALAAGAVGRRAAVLLRAARHTNDVGLQLVRLARRPHSGVHGLHRRGLHLRLRRVLRRPFLRI